MPSPRPMGETERYWLERWQAAGGKADYIEFFADGSMEIAYDFPASVPLSEILQALNALGVSPDGVKVATEAKDASLRVHLFADRFPIERLFTK
ncbi:protein of unknown function [Candidatus Hydrogenisulfobacillus filiaventi]|uniref:Uncharacterized protein n=1 Tax=Candidatus Hydrogenisulfobacillus filiaventi TaxID=2707344 RepID=A0A6F8ZI31_9FIRM|nr:protein of unknown function [Candidatus Hydrogenisulfobacillus filiaventi]